MNKLLLTIAFATGIYVNAQVSTTRINDFKLGEKKSNLERIIGKSINVPMTNNDFPSEVVNIVHKGVVYEVFFTPAYNDNGEQLNDLQVYSVKSKDKTLKTLSGIKVGSTFNELLEKYKDYNIQISDTWDDTTGNRTKKERSFMINDYDAGSYLIFTIKNGLVTDFFVGYNEGC